MANKTEKTDPDNWEKCVGSFYQEPAWHRRMRELPDGLNEEPDWPVACKNN